MIPKICLRGSADKTQAARIIEFLTRVGGVNGSRKDGAKEESYYHIREGEIWEALIAPPSDYTLITLQPDVLLPVSWCVKASESVIKYLTNKVGGTFLGFDNYYYGEGHANWCAFNPFGIVLTESQFLALTAPSAKEEREIEGYVCPMDLYGGGIEKGDTWPAKWKVNTSTYNNGVYNLPAEIVETWEPKYKEEKIIIAGKDVQLKNEYIIYNESTFSALTIRQVLNELNLFGATHLTMSGEQVPVSTLEKILNKLK